MSDSTTDPLPLGDACDPMPRPLPVRQTINGKLVRLEPLHPRHVDDLWEAMQGDDHSWTYMAYGPFTDRSMLAQLVAQFATHHDPMFWAIRRIATGRVEGWLALLDIQPANAAIELGNIWFAPNLRRTRAATEAIYMAIRVPMEDLGYRRLTWKCNALNAASRRAADRLGFTFEGVLRAHMVIKAHRRDTAYYSILIEEWPAIGDALRHWLEDDNANPDGTPRQSLATLRHQKR